MSVTVIDSVMKHSEAKLGARLVLFVLADAAGPEGISWLHLREIAKRSKISMTHIAEECIPALVKSGEIELRKAQRGRKRQNVYRVCLPGIADVNPEHLPFALNEPFTDSDIPKSSEEHGYGRSEADGFGSSEVPIRDPSIEDPYHSEASPPRGSEQALPEKSSRKRNLPFDALASYWPGYVPKKDGPRVAKYLSEIRDRLAWEAENIERLPERVRIRAILEQDAVDPLENELLFSEIHARADMYRARWRDVEFTPKALAEHFTRVTTGKPGGKLDARALLSQVDPSKLGRAS